MPIIEINNQYYFADNPLTEEEINDLKNHPFIDIDEESRKKTPSPFMNINIYASSVLQRAIGTYGEKPSHSVYKNELDNNDSYKEEIKQKQAQTNLLYLFPDYTISNDDIDDILKEDGLQIIRKPEYYQLQYSDEKEKVIITNNYGEEALVNTGPRAFFNSNKNTITVFDRAFGASEDFIEIYKKTEKELKSIPETEYTKYFSSRPMEESIYQSYSECQKYITTQNSGSSAIHELKHKKTSLLINNRRKNPNAGGISTEHAANLCEHDEKSAILAETIHTINRYFTGKGPLSEVFAKLPIKDPTLIEKPEAEIKEKLSDMNYVVNAVSESWNFNYGHSSGTYAKQFSNTMMHYGYKSLPNKIYHDDEEYKYQRSLMYTMEVYNNNTHKMETIDLSKFIKKDAETIKMLSQETIDKVDVYFNSRNKVLSNMGISDVTIIDLQMEIHQKKQKSIDINIAKSNHKTNNDKFTNLDQEAKGTKASGVEKTTECKDDIQQENKFYLPLTKGHGM